MLLRTRHLPPSATIKGLKYWWPFDDVLSPNQVVQEVVQGKHAQRTSGTIYGGNPHLGRWPINSRRVRAARFLETAGGFTTPTLASPNPQFTICLWWQFSATPAANAYGTLFSMNGGGGRLQLLYRSKYVWYTSNSNQDASTFGPKANVPTHIALTYDGTQYHLVENGIQLNSVTASGSTSFSTTANIGGGMEMKFLRDVRVYDRGLSTAELRMIWSEGFTPPPTGVEDYALIAAAAASGAKFRRTLSHLGTRSGSRQVHRI